MYSSKVLRIRATNNLEADPKSYTQMEYTTTENYMLCVHSGGLSIVMGSHGIGIGQRMCTTKQNKT